MTLRVSTAQKLVLSAVASCAAVALAAWGFGIAVDHIRYGEVAHTDLRQKIEDLADERRRARVSEGLLRGRESDIARITAIFANRRSPVAFIEAIERAAAETGSTIVVDIDEGASTDVSLRFRLSLEGGEQGLLNFVRTLELMPAKVAIRDITYQKGGVEGGRVSMARLLLSLDVAAR